MFSKSEFVIVRGVGVSVDADWAICTGGSEGGGCGNTSRNRRGS